MAKRVNRFEEILLVWTLIIIVVLIFSQVVGRYVFNSAPSWTEEAARYVHILQVWLGASYAVKLREHIRVEVFVNFFHGIARKILESAAIIIWFLLVFFLAIYGTKIVIVSFQNGQVSPAAQIPFWIPYLAIPIGSAGMSIRLIFQLIEIWIGKSEPKREGNAL